MNIQGYGTGSFSDIMNSSHKRNQIPLVNQIVSYKDTEDGEIYRAYFTDDKVTSHNAVGQKAWETAINDALHAQKIKESLGGITLYSCDNTMDKKAGFIAEFIDYDKFHKAWMSQGADTPFSYTENKGFNEAENSISLVQGMSVRLNNGFMLSITESMVQALGDFRDNTAAKESAAVASALSHLIKAANGQIPMNMFYSKNQDNSAYAKMGLEAFGIDTSRPFTINEKTFHYDREGQIRLGSGV